MKDFVLLNLDQVVKITAKDSIRSEKYLYIDKDIKMFGFITIGKKRRYSTHNSSYICENPNEIENTHLENGKIFRNPRIILTFSDQSVEVIHCESKNDMNIKLSRIQSGCKNLSGELNNFRI